MNIGIKLDHNEWANFGGNLGLESDEVCMAGFGNQRAGLSALLARVFYGPLGMTDRGALVCALAAKTEVRACVRCGRLVETDEGCSAGFGGPLGGCADRVWEAGAEV